MQKKILAIFIILKIYLGGLILCASELTEEEKAAASANFSTVSQSLAAVDLSFSLVSDHEAMRIIPPRCEQPEDGYFNVLAIDGGGTRGIIPTELLKRFEEITGKPVSSTFDLIVGVSAGSLVAGALTAIDPKDGKSARYLAADMIPIFPTFSKNLFRMSWASLWRLCKNGFGLWGSIFPPENIQSAIAEVMGQDKLANARTGRAFLAFDMTTGQSKIFSNQKATKNPDENCLTAEAMAASSSIPIVFPAGAVNFFGGATHYYADGGTLVNNPTELAFAEAVNILLEQRKKRCSKDNHSGENTYENPQEPSQKQCPEYIKKIKEQLTRVPKDKKIRILSLGCGQTNSRTPEKNAQNWGILQWANQLFIKALGASSIFTDQVMKEVLPETGKNQRYFRFDPEINLFTYAQVGVTNSYFLSKLKEIGVKAADDPEFIKVCKIFNNERVG